MASTSTAHRADPCAVPTAAELEQFYERLPVTAHNLFMKINGGTMAERNKLWVSLSKERKEEWRAAFVQLQQDAAKASGTQVEKKKKGYKKEAMFAKRDEAKAKMSLRRSGRNRK